MPTSYFTYDGVDSRTFSCYVFDRDTSGGTGPVYDQLTIPGKDGSVLISTKRRGNVNHTYQCVIYNNAMENLENLREFLLSRTGYKRLTDSFHTDEFYSACYMDSFSPVISRDRGLCKCLISFSRKPQRFLTSGETERTITSNTTIVNPTRFSSKPLLRVSGTGSLGIGGTTIGISYNPSYLYIDCEIMECYYNATSHNDKITLSTQEYPVLSPGSNGITLSGISQVRITPRWYRM